LHDYESVNSCGNVVEHDPRTLGKPFQLPHWRGLQDIENPEKYKTRKKAFPRERGGDQRDELTGDFIDYDELGIFAGRSS
jgi:hypothetical protein